MKKTNVENIKEDDTLFGLLSVYKAYSTYFRILISEENNIILQITSNPKKWPKIGEKKIEGYRLLKRSEIGAVKLFVKYLAPKHLLDQFGPILGMKIPEHEVKINDSLDSDGVYSLEIKSKFMHETISIIERIVDLSPQKKYELLEKSLSKDTEGKNHA